MHLPLIHLLSAIASTHSAFAVGVSPELIEAFASLGKAGSHFPSASLAAEGSIAKEAQNVGSSASQLANGNSNFRASPFAGARSLNSAGSLKVSDLDRPLSSFRSVKPGSLNDGTGSKLRKIPLEIQIPIQDEFETPFLARVESPVTPRTKPLSANEQLGFLSSVERQNAVGEHPTAKDKLWQPKVDERIANDLMHNPQHRPLEALAFDVEHPLQIQASPGDKLHFRDKNFDFKGERFAPKSHLAFRNSELAKYATRERYLGMYKYKARARHGLHNLFPEAGKKDIAHFYVGDNVRVFTTMDMDRQGHFVGRLLGAGYHPSKGTNSVARFRKISILCARDGACQSAPVIRFSMNPTS